MASAIRSCYGRLGWTNKGGGRAITGGFAAVLLKAKKAFGFFGFLKKAKKAKKKNKKKNNKKKNIRKRI